MSYIGPGVTHLYRECTSMTLWLYVNSWPFRTFVDLTGPLTVDREKPAVKGSNEFKRNIKDLLHPDDGFSSYVFQELASF